VDLITTSGRNRVEFSEKLQQLRKQNNMTQEELAGQLFVSRTAISKWESGKGYPNIESLKSISKLYEVSIDDLLSNEELITLATAENQSNMRNVFGFVFSILDFMAIAFIFLPLYGQPRGDYIYSVSLLDYYDTSLTIRSIYYVIYIIMALVGLAGFVIQFLEKDNYLKINKYISVGIHTFAIIFFIMTRQPYVTFFLFMFFIIKVILLIKNQRIK
jgi:transcriptional regulator with XRE-family HTH domain